MVPLQVLSQNDCRSSDVKMSREITTEHFVPGLELAASFFHEAVGPIIDSHYPDLRYSAALIGCGSEVFGYDTEMSTDHHWGPRVMIFLRPEDFDTHRREMKAILADELPAVFRSYPTNFSEPDFDDNGVQHLRAVDSGPINHLAEIFTLRGFFLEYMNIDIDADLEPSDWLTLPHQRLRSICGGAVFRDDLGLESIRKRFAWYPHDVWLYLLASCWSRLGEEEHLMGRAGDFGDEIGSALIASRLVRDIMRLAFLMERVYPPYSKWFGTAFRELGCAEELEPVLEAVLNTRKWEERESSLCKAYGIVAKMHNNLEITEPLTEAPALFHGRPFRVIDGGAFAEALTARIKDVSVKSIASQRLIGSVDLFSDSTDLLEDESRRLAIKTLYSGDGLDEETVCPSEQDRPADG